MTSALTSPLEPCSSSASTRRTTAISSRSLSSCCRPSASGQEDSSRIIGYLGDAGGERSIDVEVLVAKIIEHAPTARQVVMNSVERLREEGRQQGREEGRQQGREEGQRAVLLKQLRVKFGGVEAADVARVEQADEAALERYLERVLTADSIDAVLGD